MDFVWGTTIRWISGFENFYAVTIDGKVASYRCHSKSNFKPIWLGQCWCGARKNCKYLAIDLYKDGKKKNRLVHQLILETFVGPRPLGMQALHKDDNRSNNHLDNLYWGTHLQNIQDAIRSGKHVSCLHNSP